MTTRLRKLARTTNLVYDRTTNKQTIAPYERQTVFSPRGVKNRGLTVLLATVEKQVAQLL
jgi:hypothetical protein